MAFTLWRKSNGKISRNSTGGIWREEFPYCLRVEVTGFEPPPCYEETTGISWYTYGGFGGAADFYQYVTKDCTITTPRWILNQSVLGPFGNIYADPFCAGASVAVSGFSSTWFISQIGADYSVTCKDGDADIFTAGSVPANTPTANGVAGAFGTVTIHLPA